MIKPLAVAFALIFSHALGAFAQAPNIAPELLKHERLLSGDTIRFCVGRDSFLREVERDIAKALADALLLDGVIVEYPFAVMPPPYDYAMSASFDDIFVLLNNECDAFMGMSMALDPTSDWMAVTRPLFETWFTLVGRRDGPRAFTDLANDDRIGVRLGSAADLRLNAFLRQQDAARRPKLAQYPDNSLLIERLRDGSLSAALIWGPAYSRLVADRDLGDSLMEMAPAPLPRLPVVFTIALRRESAYLRLMLDQAIAQLAADGTMDAVLAAHHISGKAVAD